MLLTDSPWMNLATPEVAPTPSLGSSSMSPSFGVTYSSLSELGFEGSNLSSPYSALSSSVDSPAFLRGMECGLAPSASAALGREELSERLQALLTLQRVHITSKNPGQGVYPEQLLPVLGMGSRLGEAEARDLLALQAALSPSAVQQGSPCRGASANTRTGPVNNPLYKTELCRSFEEFGTCRYGSKCQFAHGRDELRHVQRHPKYKTEICRTFATTGTCPYGTRCRFIHQSAALAQLRIASAATPNGSPGASFHESFGVSPRSQDERDHVASAINAVLSPSVGSLGSLRSLSPGFPRAGSNTPLGTSVGMMGGACQPQRFSSPFLSGLVGQQGGVETPGLLSPVASPPMGLFVNTTPSSAPNTPHGNMMGQVRRVVSDNSLAASGNTAVTPTSARRLPIFSSLAEEEIAKV